MKLFLTLAGIALWGWTTAQTQLTETPDVSQAASVMQQIGLTRIQVDYHRPSVQGRTVWGELIPYGQVWRGGANENTTITFSTEVVINDQSLAAGCYGLHFLVMEDQATVIFSNNHTSWGSFSYSEDEDALRVTVPIVAAAPPQEWLTYSFNDLKPATATCSVTWGDRSIAFQIGVDVHETVVADLQEQLRSKAGWSWQGWHEAAGYCLNNNTHLSQGLQWAVRSVVMNPNGPNIIRKAQLTSAAQSLQGNQAIDAQMQSIQSDLDRGNVTWKEYSAAASYAAGKARLDEAGIWADVAIKQGGGMTPAMVKVNILEKQGKSGPAKELKEKAIAAGSNQELNTYGYQLLYGGKTKEAVEIFEANVAKNGDDPNVWDSLGEGYLMSGEMAKASEALKKCLSLNPPPVLKTHAEALMKQIMIN